MLDLTIHPEVVESNARYCREKGITLPTFAMMRDPSQIPGRVKETLQKTGLWDVSPANLYRVTWKNEPQDHGGLFGGVNHFVVGPELSGVRARIVVLVGRWFPTGAHKVGAAYGCLVPRLVTGQFNPQTTKAVWPSTGNYCRGGAYLASLLACSSVAILPEGMSRERFEWLRTVAGEIIPTPGTEANVKEIFDKCAELAASGQDLRIFNQFDELGNALWHHEVTGPAVEELLGTLTSGRQGLKAFVAASGSAGTLGAGYYLKKRFPQAKLAVAEALQCPTLSRSGYGDHRIEGIGDKHVPWIHDAKETDFVIAIDDEIPMRLLRLFNDHVGRHALTDAGVAADLTGRLDLFGISGLANLTAAIKLAKYLEMDENDVIVTVATDSMDLYRSRMHELAVARGAYSGHQAIRDLELLASLGIDHVKELGYYDRKAIHHLKYFTWVEQQGKSIDELNNQWSKHDDYWTETFNQTPAIDRLIQEFNERTWGNPL
jgi:cysteine synthase